MGAWLPVRGAFEVEVPAGNLESIEMSDAPSVRASEVRAAAVNAAASNASASACEDGGAWAGAEPIAGCVAPPPPPPPPPDAAAVGAALAGGGATTAVPEKLVVVVVGFGSIVQYVAT